MLTLELHITDAQSLKDKRSAAQPEGQAAVQVQCRCAELDHQDVCKRSVVGVVTLSTEESMYARSCRKPG